MLNGMGDGMTDGALSALMKNCSCLFRLSSKFTGPSAFQPLVMRRGQWLQEKKTPIQADKMGLLCRVAGLSLREIEKISVVQEGSAGEGQES